MLRNHAVPASRFPSVCTGILLISIFHGGLQDCLAAGADQGSEFRGREIMQRVYKNTIGQNRVSHEVLTLVQPGQRSRIRNLNLFRKVDENEVRTLIRFTGPASVRRMGILSIEKQDGSADQWIFFPAASTVRRIPGSRKGDRFAGSDFFYEDILLRMATEETYSWVSGDTLKNESVDLIESKPSTLQSSAYSRRLLWIATEKNIPLRIDFFKDSDALPFKRFETLDTIYQSGQFTISKAVMHDLETGHSTYLESHSISHGLELPDNIFTTQALEDGHFEHAYAPSP